MCHTSNCPHKNEPCERGSTCGGLFAVGCDTKCEPTIHKPHKFSMGAPLFLDKERPDKWLGQNAHPSKPKFDDLPLLRDDETVPIFDITGKTTYRLLEKIETMGSGWLDEGSKSNPLTKLEKQLMWMAREGVPLATEGGRDIPKDEQSPFAKQDVSFSFLGSPRSREVNSSTTLPRRRSGRQPPNARSGGMTAVTQTKQIPGVRVWVTDADQILEATGMVAQDSPDDPKNGGAGSGETAVYVRFRNDGKLKNAGAGYWLTPSLSHLITSIYNGLAFKSQQQSDFVDIGIAQGERTCLTSPYCYPASLSPAVTTYTCKKGNIYAGAECHVSFRLGDVGVGHPEWVEVTRVDGGMNQRSEGGGPGYNRLLLIMTELLTTRILEVINAMK